MLYKSTVRNYCSNGTGAHNHLLFLSLLLVNRQMRNERTVSYWIRSQFDDKYKLLDIEKASKNIHSIPYVICDSCNFLEFKYVFKVNYTPTKNILEFIFIGYVYILSWLFSQGSESRIHFLHQFFFVWNYTKIEKNRKEFTAAWKISPIKFLVFGILMKG